MYILNEGQGKCLWNLFSFSTPKSASNIVDGIPVHTDGIVCPVIKLYIFCIFENISDIYIHYIDLGSFNIQIARKYSEYQSALILIQIL